MKILQNFKRQNQIQTHPEVKDILEAETKITDMTKNKKITNILNNNLKSVIK